MSRILGFAILGYLLFLIYSCSSSVSNIEAVCASTLQGTYVDEVIKQIEMKELTYKQTDDSIFVHSSANFGRLTCTLSLIDGRVVASELVFLD